jgi:hypothetical protein
MNKQDIAGFVEFLQHELDADSKHVSNELAHMLDTILLMNQSEIITKIDCIQAQTNSVYVQEYLEELSNMILYPEK